jgi:ABC-2 type transport system ATP-binding protein
MASVEELCDNIMLINKGEKILEGSVYQVKQNFKENKFEVILRRKDSEAICLPEGFTIVSEKENKNEETTFIISSDKENNPNILINYLTEKGTIVSYRELLPSINDIFINKVNGIM